MERDMNWGREHLVAVQDAIKYHCAMHIIGVRLATEKEDLEEATDMIIEIKGGAVGVRIRRPEYYKYGDITIRYSRPSRARTEWHKLKDDSLHWYFYGWSDGHENLQDWCLLDMHKFPFLEENKLKIEVNNDGTTFACFSLAMLKACGCLIVQKKDVMRSESD